MRPQRRAYVADASCQGSQRHASLAMAVFRSRPTGTHLRRWADATLLSAPALALGCLHGRDDFLAPLPRLCRGETVHLFRLEHRHRSSVTLQRPADAEEGRRAHKHPLALSLVELAGDQHVDQSKLVLQQQEHDASSGGRSLAADHEARRHNPLMRLHRPEVFRAGHSGEAQSNPLEAHRVVLGRQLQDLVVRGDPVEGREVGQKHLVLPRRKGQAQLPWARWASESPVLHATAEEAELPQQLAPVETEIAEGADTDEVLHCPGPYARAMYEVEQRAERARLFTGRNYRLCACLPQVLDITQADLHGVALDGALGTAHVHIRPPHVDVVTARVVGEDVRWIEAHRPVVVEGAVELG